jgi:hypothetical protein
MYFLNRDFKSPDSYREGSKHSASGGRIGRKKFFAKYLGV